MSEAALLEIRDLHAYYDNIAALRGVSLDVQDGEIVALIGANGAGKSTLLKCISGLVTPRGGEIYLEGRRINGVKAHEMVRFGVAMVPEGRKIFGRLTVLENLEMGAFTRSDKAAVAESFEQVFDLFPRLAERRGQVGGTLSGGEQQMLAIGRAIMAAPRLLLLDEPSMGLAPILVQQIFSHPPRNQPEGRLDPAGGAERKRGSESGASGLRAAGRGDRARGLGHVAAGKRAGQRGLSRRALEARRADPTAEARGCWPGYSRPANAIAIAPRATARRTARRRPAGVSYPALPERPRWR